MPRVEEGGRRVKSLAGPQKHREGDPIAMGERGGADGVGAVCEQSGTEGAGDGTVAAGSLGDREQPALRAGRGVCRRCQPDQEGIGAGGDGGNSEAVVEHLAARHFGA